MISNMTGTTNHISPDAGVVSDPAGLICALEAKGVSISLENGHLRYRAARGSVTPEDIVNLKLAKQALVDHLTRHREMTFDTPRNVGFPLLQRAPLAFSQLAHWNLYDLGRRPSRCVIPTLTRIQGALDAAVILESIEIVVRRHDALRTRIVLRDGLPMQEIHDCKNLKVPILDWTGLPPQNREERLERVAWRLCSVTVTVDPLLAIYLIELDRRDHALLVRMEHLISDGRSIDIFHEEVFSAYRQLIRGQMPSFPEVPTQFPQYARCQRLSGAVYNSSFVAHINEKFRACGRVRFPGKPERTGISAGMGMVNCLIDRDLHMELAKWSRDNRTTLVMTAFVAYAALALRWCAVDDMVILFQVDGRSFQTLGPSIGYYAFPLFMRAHLGKQDTFLDFLKKMTDEYCSGYTFADFSYLESKMPRPEFTRNCCFNWINRNQDEATVSVQELDDEPMISRVEPGDATRMDLVRDTEPMLGMRESAAGLRAAFAYSECLTSASAMQEFAANYLMFLRTLTTRPQRCIREIRLL